MALSHIKVKQMSFSQMIILYPMAFCHTMVKQMTFSQMMTHIMAFHHKMFQQVTYGQMIFYHLHFIVLRFIYFHVVKSCLPNNVWKNVLFQMKLHPMTFCGMTCHPTLTTIRDLILTNGSILYCSLSCQSISPNTIWYHRTKSSFYTFSNACGTVWGSFFVSILWS